VEIPGWTRDGNLVVRDASESIGQSRGSRVEPVVVRLKACSEKRLEDRRVGITHNTDCINAIEIGVLSFFHLGEDEFIEAFRAGFFHAFETEAKVYRKGFVEGMVCIEYVDPAKDGTLVIGRTTAV